MKFFVAVTQRIASSTGPWMALGSDFASPHGPRKLLKATTAPAMAETVVSIRGRGDGG
jgi:hypothetical protein